MDYISMQATATPVGNAPTLETQMGGTDKDIPIVSLPGRFAEQTFSIHLGNCDNAEQWLRESAEALLELAETVAIQRDSAALAAMAEGEAS